MKKVLLSAAVMLLSLANVFAQGIDTTLLSANHEIKIFDNEKKIDIKVFELKDGVRVSNEPIYQSYYNFDVKDVDRTVIIRVPFSDSKVIAYSNGADSVVSERSFFCSYRSLEQPLPNLYFNYINIGDGVFGPKSTVIPQRPVSYEWGMYFPMTIFCTGGRTVFGMATGVGFSNSYNDFDTKYVMKKDGNGDVAMVTLAEVTDGRFVESEKSYLRYWSFRLPLTMQLQWRVGVNTMTVSAGAEVEWRCGMRSFAKYDGAKRTMDDKLIYRPFGCNALFQVGYAGVILFSRFGLTDMFGSNSFNATQFAAGIGFNF